MMSSQNHRKLYELFWSESYTDKSREKVLSFTSYLVTTHRYQVQKAALTDLRKMRSRFRNMLDEGMIDQNRRIKEGVEEIMERQYDPTANTKPYILASFGSAWVCLRVRMIIKTFFKSSF